MSASDVLASVPLRSAFWRLRRPSVDVRVDGTVAIRVPTIFALRPFIVPVHGTAVFDALAAGGSLRPVDPLLLDALRIPVLQTSVGREPDPDVVLLFATPQRVPRVRRFAALSDTTQTVGYRESRRSEGLFVDGVRIETGRPIEAVASLRAAGLESGPSWVDWIAVRRSLVIDDRERHQAAKSLTRTTRWGAALGVLGALAIVGHFAALLPKTLAFIGFAIFFVALLAAGVATPIVRARTVRTRRGLARRVVTIEPHLLDGSTR